MTEGPSVDEEQGLEGWAALAGESADARVTVFMSDPSAEAERVAQLLRAAAYLVVDVPLSMLATRVAVQTPRVILVDADATGAREAIASVRTGQGGGSIEIVLLGEAPPEEESSTPSSLSDGSPAFFARPVDAAALVGKIAALTGGAESTSPVSVPSSPAPRPGSPRPAKPPSVQPETVAIPEHLVPIPSSLEPSTAPLSARPPPSSAPGSGSLLSARSARPAVSIQTTLSAELEALLAEADHRIGEQMAREVAPPTPEEEIEAVLPAALLAALDEPIGEDEEDMPLDMPRSMAESSSDARDRGAQPERPPETNPGRALTPAPKLFPEAESLGVAPTMAAPALAEAEFLMSIPVARVPSLASEDPPRPPVPTTGPATTLGRDDAPQHLALAISARTSGCITFASDDGVRHVVLRDGDIVTAASSADDEALLVFLTTRGDLRRDQVKDLVGKVPPFGRHAGAALIGHGVLKQDQLWPTLRAHAEWLLGRALLVTQGTSRFDVDAPGRLRQEPSVFGGSSGAEVLVEVARRVIAPEEALRRLGGADATVADGPSALLGECALDAQERAIILGARGATMSEIVTRGGSADLTAVVYALSLLGVLVVAAPAFAPRRGEPGSELDPPTAGAIHALDVAAVRERVRARFDLVSEADYFTLLGVSPEATGYEVRRAYLELRRTFEPSRILSPEIVDLENEVSVIVDALDEAYEILRDAARRERYRRALGDSP